MPHIMTRYQTRTPSVKRRRGERGFPRRVIAVRYGGPAPMPDQRDNIIHQNDSAILQQ